MTFRYHFDLIEESSESLILAESANYGGSATCIVVAFLSLAVAAFTPSRSTTFACILFSLPFLGGAAWYSIRSRIVLDETRKMLLIRRSLGFVTWTVRYPIEGRPASRLA